MILHWFLLILGGVSLGSEMCRNYPTTYSPGKFREGKWMEQLRIHSGKQHHFNELPPNDTVSLFNAKYKTYCGFYELQTLSKKAFQLNKGYFIPRFDHHFFPFQALIIKEANQIKCKMVLESSICDEYATMTKVIEAIDILYTDYTTFMIIHQCIDDDDYIMFLTESENLYVPENDKVDVERLLIDILKGYEIEMKNQTFTWRTAKLCESHVKLIHPIFYQKTFIKEPQKTCPENLSVDIVDLRHYWENKLEREEQMWQEKKSFIICVVCFIVGMLSILGLLAVFLDNFKV
ncbi:CLUMA_CG007165, isoform A [Clunio marinus]|uniref:CLUMA_CG007165, isoform A n=1 Tax=Clunio marinus TaxID=568069 RepID=A0A1J1I0A6_9DIPT|nr:CLUMA_CG007165, isoform A [Clunio marinus]